MCKLLQVSDESYEPRCIIMMIMGYAAAYCYGEATDRKTHKSNYGIKIPGSREMYAYYVYVIYHVYITMYICNQEES